MVDEGLNKLEELEKERLSEFLKHHVKLTNQISYFEKAIQSCNAKKRRELLKRIFKNLKLTKTMDLKNKQIHSINLLVERLTKSLTPEETEKLLSPA